MDAAVEQYALNHGGTQQRIANAALVGICPPATGFKESFLALTLVEMVSYGLLQLPWVQQIAQDAVADGLLHPELVKISSMGNSGQTPGNLSRDFNAACS